MKYIVRLAAVALTAAFFAPSGALAFDLLGALGFGDRLEEAARRQNVRIEYPAPWLVEYHFSRDRDGIYYDDITRAVQGAFQQDWMADDLYDRLLLVRVIKQQLRRGETRILSYGNPKLEHPIGHPKGNGDVVEFSWVVTFPVVAQDRAENGEDWGPEEVYRCVFEVHVLHQFSSDGVRGSLRMSKVVSHGQFKQDDANSMALLAERIQEIVDGKV